MNIIYLYALFGGLGALIKDIIEDNSLELPKIKEGKFYLGCFGGIITGAIVGYITDSNLISAFTAGYTGSSLLTTLVVPTVKNLTEEKKSPEIIIREIASKEKVDQDLAVRVAKCESGLDIKAVHTNTTGTRDRGLFQINDYYHPEVTDAQAFDPVFSTEFFCKAVKAGHLSWWDSSKKCWNV